MHNGISQQTTLQMSHSPNKSQYYDISRNGNRYGNGEQQQQQQQQPRWVNFNPLISLSHSLRIFSCNYIGIIKTVTDTITLRNNKFSNHRMLIDPIHCLVQWYSHTIKWLDITRKTDAIEAVTIRMVAIKIIIIVRLWNVLMEQTHQTFISCHPKESIQERS